MSDEEIIKLAEEFGLASPGEPSWNVIEFTYAVIELVRKRGEKNE